MRKIMSRHSESHPGSVPRRVSDRRDAAVSCVGDGVSVSDFAASYPFFEESVSSRGHLLLLSEAVVRRLPAQTVIS